MKINCIRKGKILNIETQKNHWKFMTSICQKAKENTINNKRLSILFCNLCQEINFSPYTKKI